MKKQSVAFWGRSPVTGNPNCINPRLGDSELGRTSKVPGGIRFLWLTGAELCISQQQQKTQPWCSETGKQLRRTARQGNHGDGLSRNPWIQFQGLGSGAYKPSLWARADSLNLHVAGVEMAARKDRRYLGGWGTSQFPRVGVMHSETKEGLVSELWLSGLHTVLCTGFGYVEWFGGHAVDCLRHCVLRSAMCRDVRGWDQGAEDWDSGPGLRVSARGKGQCSESWSLGLRPEGLSLLIGLGEPLDFQLSDTCAV